MLVSKRVQITCTKNTKDSYLKNIYLTNVLLLLFFKGWNIRLVPEDPQNKDNEVHKEINIQVG